MSQYRDQNRNAALTNLHHETNFMEEKEKMEEEYQEQIRQLEEKVKGISHELGLTKKEIDRLTSDLERVSQDNEDLEDQRKLLKEELKELKERQQRTQDENNELEDENVSLQKQVSNLKSSQVEYEALKVEVTGIVEENDSLRSIVEDAKHLQLIAEKQTEEALSAAQHEREQRIAYAKELEDLKNKERLSSLNSLCMSMTTAKAENDEARVNALEQSIIADGPIESVNFNEGADLFSEIHGNEIKKLKEDNEKLSKELNDVTSNISKAVAPMLQKLQINGLSGK